MQYFYGPITGCDSRETYYVDNLNASGPGSLHDAIATSDPQRPRHIEVMISGTTEAMSAVYEDKGNLTISGNGLCVRGDMRFNHSVNIVIHHLRIRSVPFTHVVKWCLFFDGCRHIEIEHCTFAWSTDEMLAFHDCENVVVRNCLMHEWCRYYAGERDCTGKSAIFCDDCDGVIIYRNVMAHTPWRAPLVHGGRFIIAENVMYNQGVACCMILSGVPGKSRNHTRVQLTDNIKLVGPACEYHYRDKEIVRHQIANCYYYGEGKAAEVYRRGNLVDDHRTNGNGFKPALVHGKYFARDEPWPEWPKMRPTPAMSRSASNLISRLANAGAGTDDAVESDAAEDRIMASIVNRDTADTDMVKYYDSWVSVLQPYHPDDIGGWLVKD